MTTIELLRISVQCGAIALTAPESAEAVDRPLARDDKDRPYVPGSSVAGSLRSHLPSPLRQELMGSDPATPDTELAPSRLRILGTELTPALAESYQRRQTKVNRTRGAAEARTLRTTEVLQAGARLDIAIIYDPLVGDGATMDRRPLSTEDLAHLASWRPILGGSRTTGLGQTTATEVYHRTLDLTDDADLLIWLQLGGMADFRRVVNERIEPPATGPTRRTHRWTFEIQDALFTAGSRADGDRRNLTAFQKVGDRYLIAGSSLKGVLRSRAEFICRTKGEQVCGTDPTTCGQCRVCRIFGAGGRSGTARRGTIAVHDAPISGADAGEVKSVKRPHVAIDRFTGGAADGRLFEHEVLVQGVFDLVIEELEELQPEDLALLQLVVDDIHAGYVGIGGGVTRGYGTVRVLGRD